MRFATGAEIHEYDLTVKSAQFFAEVPKLTDKLRVLDEVGLGYLRLGNRRRHCQGRSARMNSRIYSPRAAK